MNILKRMTWFVVLLFFTSSCSHKSDVRKAGSIPDVPLFTIKGGEIVGKSIEIVSRNGTSSSTEKIGMLRLRLSEPKAAEFRMFVKMYGNQTVPIMVGTNIVKYLVPVTYSGQEIQIVFASPDEARAAEDSLSEQ